MVKTMSEKVARVLHAIIEPEQEKVLFKNDTSMKDILSSLWEKFSCTPPSSSKENSKDSDFHCAICLTTCDKSDAHSTKKCNHQVCQNCIRQYFTITLTDVRYTTFEAIECPNPGCKKKFKTTNTLLEGFFTKAEIEQWWCNALIKTCITTKIYCPMEKCGAVFDVDEAYTKKCTFSECYECHRGFCIACQAPWHPGEIKLFDDKKDIEMTLKQAKKNSWCRCPNCSLIVEKKDGCLHMTCQCKTKFCYRCGRIDSNCRDNCVYLTDSQLNTLRDTMFVQ